MLLNLALHYAKAERFNRIDARTADIHSLKNQIGKNEISIARG